MPETVEVSLCIATYRPVRLWLEPWAEEGTIPAGAELRLICHSDHATTDPTPEIEFDGDMLVVWGAGGSRIEAWVDGRSVGKVCAILAAPEAGPTGTRGFLEAAFGSPPPVDVEAATSGKGRWLRRLLSRLSERP